VKISVCPYRRSFRQPLLTHHGAWSVRDGIILRLSNLDGQVGFGEIAPLEWFGSESLEQALSFCSQLTGSITAEAIASIPPHLPACRFGFESAWESLNQPQSALELADPLVSSKLLPAGMNAIPALKRLTGKTDTNSTFKWKIAVAPLLQELDWFKQLTEVLPNGSTLRLDANGGLSPTEACRWLEVCDATEVEFLEQPLPPSQFEVMLELDRQFKTPIALDESVSTLEQLKACYDQGWRGIFVVKAAIAGSPAQLRKFCQAHKPDIVWSSVFETAIAQQFIQTRLIATLPHSHRATGFGVNHWFCDRLDQSDFEHVWQTLSLI
jgi:o-succinylbenzoate synthase